MDSLITYGCPDTKKMLLIVHNVLYVESMDHNFISPFIICESGIEVNDRPTIHHPTGTPSVTDYPFGSVKHGLLILFKLSEILSIFDSRKPTNNNIIYGTPL